MTRSTYSTRLIRMLVLGAIVAGTVTSVAAALPVVDNDATSAQANFPTPQGLKADGLRLQGIAQVYQQIQAVPDVLERYATAHPYGSGLAVSQPADRDTSYRAAAQAVPVPLPDAFERFATAHPYGSGLPSVTASPSTVSDGFNWGDWAIGIGTGMGMILFLVGGLGIGRQLRHRVQTA